MTDAAQDNETLNSDAHDSMESNIKAAMSSRVSHFKEQADSLTFEGVRRLIEKDLGLETHALDVHKKFIKQCLVECMEGGDDDNATKSSEKTTKENVSSTEREEEKSPDQSTNDAKESHPEDVEKMEDSPVMGLLTGHKTSKSEAKETQGDEIKELQSQSTIKKAIKKRAAYVKANSEKVTMAGLRRLLEEDLKLDKYSLDSYKKMISEELEKVLNSSEVLEPSNADKKKSLEKNSHSKGKEVSSVRSSDSSDGEEEEELKPRKKIVSKGKTQNNEGIRKRKGPEKETKVASKKQMKAAKTVPDNNDVEDSRSVSDNDRSQSSAEKPIKKKEVSTPAYGKRVEHLRTVIKSCGMSVPPSVYRKVKQAPENKREAQLIKELEDILSRERLSSNPSEKEIKEVRKRKERARELEGIDMSNIVSSSRRRSTTSFIPPPKPKIPDESDSSDSDDDDSENDVNEDNDDDNGDNDGGDDSLGEESKEEDDEGSD